MTILSSKSFFGSLWMQKQSLVLDTQNQCSWLPDTAPKAAQKIDVEVIPKKKTDALCCGANEILSSLFDLAAE